MKLLSFRVRDFRSIRDSGVVTLAFSKDEKGRNRSVTALVGRNESGKSNLLLALSTLRPPDGRQELTMIKDFPRDRHAEEWDPDFRYLFTTWSLDDVERRELATLSPAFLSVSEATVSRTYDAQLFIGFNVPPATFDMDAHSKRVRKLLPLLRGQLKGIEDEAERASVTSAIDGLDPGNPPPRPDAAWCTTFLKSSEAVRDTLGAAGIVISDAADDLLAEAETEAEAVPGYQDASAKARAYVVQRIPHFVYVAEFPQLSGHQNIEELLYKQHVNHAHPGKKRQDHNESELNFLKMAKVAGFDPERLYKLGAAGHEERSQLLNRAGAVISSRLRERWKDRSLKVRYNLDGNHLDTLVSDPNTSYDVEVNLDERSRGLRWFFAFYVTFTADTQGGDSDGAILLLDEPGLFLHAMSQGDLLRHLKTDFANQIVFTTHSPFMIPPDDLASARTVNISQDEGTTVTDSPTGDERTLFPLQAALGWTLAQSLFVGPNNLLVEGVTDFWILSAVNQWMKQNGAKGVLPVDLALTPVGGAGKMAYMAALLTGQRLNVFALLDGDKAGRDAQQELVRGKLLNQKSIFFVTEAFDPPPSEADIEDLLDPTVYEDLARRAYAKELAKVTLKLNDKIPRIVKRFELAFEEKGLAFDKGRPARLFMAEMAMRPAELVDAVTKTRFQRLFSVIVKRMTTAVAAAA
ncbi:ATPase AAA-type core domain-containing protein [Methylorubrum aminovorans]